MKNILFTNWNIMRIIRLAFAIILFVQAAQKFEWYLVIFGLFFLIQALFNFGCGANGCAIPKK
ncbi:hypothetical protein [Flavobacterium sp.]|jgi:hypothetical protein|uniref:hypothetical protein n=1 Tax=Flavobacterium sp. TaxID=239 RepID=UPI0037BEDA3C